jgi:hypothetical protein
MCEECGEAPVQFVAYFNKPGGKHWRPPQRLAAPSPLVGEGRGGGSGSGARPRINSPTPTPDPSPQGGGEGRAFVCEETRAE